MRLLRLSLCLALTLFILSCSLTFPYKTSKSLRGTHAHVVSGDGVKFYYNIGKSGNVDIAIKNVSGLMYKTLELDISDNTGKLNIYKSYGNIKNLGVRNLNIQVNDNTNFVRIKYTYLPVKEDSFLNPNKGFEDLPDISGIATLIIKY
ncbi:hypothetical protein DSN97_08070 [Deferribacteraceae bacterium V6Fe1]|nr:hypothetical protein DSN97_08070 [Deferribacteraceae bacterium V6Fe1]